VGGIASAEDYAAPIGPGTPRYLQSTVGRSGNMLWHATPSFVERTVVSTEDLASFLDPKTTNHVFRFVSAMGQIFFRFLDLGLYDVEPGSYRFDGNRFTVRLNRGGESEGEMLLEQGLVTRIRFQIPGLQKRFVSELEYGGNADVPDFLPTHVVQKVFGAKGDFERISLDFKFLRLEWPTNRLEDAFFSPDRFYESSPTRSRVSQLTLSNGLTYQRMGGPGAPLAPVPSLHSSSRSVFWVFLIAAGGVVVLLPILFVRLKR
jgi:hypothetical protein